MKFTKGLIVGSMITAGVMILYTDGNMSTKKWVKKGKQMAKKMGIL